jgi:hypothetical protein
MTPRSRIGRRRTSSPLVSASDRVLGSRARTRRTALSALTFALGVFAAGCAPALPTFSGGSTTPHDREDLAVGLAARAPALDLSAPSGGGADELLTLAAPGGVVPAGALRFGLDGGWDLGVVVAGSGGRLEVRTGGLLGSSVTWHVGAAISGAYQRSEARQIDDDTTLAGAEGYRVGGLVPLSVGMALGGIFEAWGTVRLGAEHVGGSVGAASGDAWTLRSGLALGLAVGFRRVHVMVELAVDFEHVRGQLGGAVIERSGLVLTPATALRIRF